MIVFTGDWHGEYDRAYRKIKSLDLRDLTIVQVGDFGIGFERRKKDLRKLDVLNEQLKGRNIMRSEERRVGKEGKTGYGTSH